MISSPKNKAINVEKTKKGPKGISLFKAFFLKITNPIAIIPPIMYVRNRQRSIFGQLRINPKNAPSFTSPKPIHRPEETKKSKRKNVATPIAERKETINGLTALNSEFRSKKR
jgi:hypothetical protein